MPDAPSGLLYLPYLKGCLTPHMDPSARACFIGVGAEHGRAAFLQAIYEGVSFEQRLILDLIEERLGRHFDRLTVSGGATMNPAWMRIKTNAMHKTLAVSRTSQTAMLGAAMRAGIGAGLFADAADAVRNACAETAELHPDPGLAAAYDEIYRNKYVKLYGALKELE